MLAYIYIIHTEDRRVLL